VSFAAWVHRVTARRVLLALLLLTVAFSASMTAAQTARPTARPRTPRPARPAAKSDAGTESARGDAGKGGGEVVQQRTLDGGAKVFRFGELEIEGRLKNPQLVFFLRRVRAEFAAGDLGHRSFLRELGETRRDPNF
jgi:hypothetical protein